MSKKFDPAECSYEIYDKELLAIVRSFQCWKADLKSSIDISVLTDHWNLEYFMTTKQLSRRQVCLSEFLSEFDFKIKYRPSKCGKKSDSIIKWCQDLLSVEEYALRRYQNQTLLKYTHIDLLIRSQYLEIFLEEPQDENKCEIVSSAKIKKSISRVSRWECELKRNDETDAEWVFKPSLARICRAKNYGSTRTRLQ